MEIVKNQYLDMDDADDCNDNISTDDMIMMLEDGDVLFRPQHIKLAITPSSKGGFHLSMDGECVHISEKQGQLFEMLNNDGRISLETINLSNDKRDFIDLVTTLHNHGILDLE